VPDPWTPPREEKRDDSGRPTRRRRKKRPRLEYARFGVRFLARAIDAAVLLAIGFVAGLITAMIMAMMGMNGKPVFPLPSGGPPLSLLGALAYHVVSERVGGATIGKIVCSLRVIEDDSTRLSWSGAVIRNLAFIIDGFFVGRRVLVHVEVRTAAAPG